MNYLGLITLVVADYDQAIAFYTGSLGFELVEDTEIDLGKRWVVVRPPHARETGILLARATSDGQRWRIGDQAGGRVGLFLYTDNFSREYCAMLAAGVYFEEWPRYESYGIVAVFQDLYGNRWDLIESN